MTIQTVIADKSGVRLDVFLSEKLAFTRSKVKNLIDGGLVTLNGKQLKPYRNYIYLQ